MTRWMRGKRGAAVLAGAVVLIGGVAAVSAMRGRVFSSPSVAVAEVQKGRFVREVTATGVLKAVTATPVVVPVDVEQMQKIAWLAKDGSAVKAGEPVVLFDPAEMEKTLADGQADRSSGEHKMEKTAAQNRKTEENLSLDLDLSRQALTEAERTAPKDADIFSRNEMIESEIDRGLLKERAEAAGSKLETSRNLGAADLVLQEIEKSKADIRIRQAERGLQSLRILAPHDGLLVMERDWRGRVLTAGEPVWPGQKIAEIPDLSVLEARVYVLEADAGGLETGKPAKVFIEGRPGAEHPARVSRIDAVAKTREWRSPTKYFETILTLEKTDPVLMKPGQNVRARILLEDIPDAVAVPRGAIFEKDGKRVVYRLENGRFAPVEVTIGHLSLSRVVVEKGLAPGDRIALRDPTRAASEIVSGRGATGAGPPPAGAGR